MSNSIASSGLKDVAQLSSLEKSQRDITEVNVSIGSILNQVLAKSNHIPIEMQKYLRERFPARPSEDKKGKDVEIISKRSASQINSREEQLSSSQAHSLSVEAKQSTTEVTMHISLKELIAKREKTTRKLNELDQMIKYEQHLQETLHEKSREPKRQLQCGSKVITKQPTSRNDNRNSSSDSTKKRITSAYHSSSSCQRGQMNDNYSPKQISQRPSSSLVGSNRYSDWNKSTAIQETNKKISPSKIKNIIKYSSQSAAKNQTIQSKSVQLDLNQDCIQLNSNKGFSSSKKANLQNSSNSNKIPWMAGYGKRNPSSEKPNKNVSSSLKQQNQSAYEQILSANKSQVNKQSCLKTESKSQEKFNSVKKELFKDLHETKKKDSKDGTVQIQIRPERKHSSEAKCKFQNDSYALAHQQNKNAQLAANNQEKRRLIQHYRQKISHDTQYLASLHNLAEQISNQNKELMFPINNFSSLEYQKEEIEITIKQQSDDIKRLEKENLNLQTMLRKAQKERNTGINGGSPARQMQHSLSANENPPLMASQGFSSSVYSISAIASQNNE